MSNTALLNNIDHKDLRIVTTRGAEYGDNVMFATTFPSEFRQLQAHYPIVFCKTGNGAGFEPIALLGLQEGENLFLDGQRWDAGYIPLMIERQPFLIGIDGEDLMINVDLDHPRVSRSEGEAVFLPFGGNSDYLERINTVLSNIHLGLQSTPGFIGALLKLELLEPFVLDVELNDGSQGRLAGFYTINEERLQALDGGALEQLQRAGYLQPIYMALASLNQFRGLIDRKNRRHAIDL